MAKVNPESKNRRPDTALFVTLHYLVFGVSFDGNYVSVAWADGALGNGILRPSPGGDAPQQQQEDFKTPLTRRELEWLWKGIKATVVGDCADFISKLANAVSVKGDSALLILAEGFERTMNSPMENGQTRGFN